MTLDQQVDILITKVLAEHDQFIADLKQSLPMELNANAAVAETIDFFIHNLLSISKSKTASIEALILAATFMELRGVEITSAFLKENFLAILQNEGII